MAQLQSIKQRFGIIGSSPKLDHALDVAIRVANTDLSVLIKGESGVGKEVFSKIIHKLSSRKHNNFIAINCGAIPEGTINSELFGHEKGSFTGAASERKGYFETVDGGTIFLDEIGEMPLDTQAYLLRILESGEFIKVGSSKVLKTDVRIVAATNVALENKMKKGKFREDLFYRLNTVPITVPSLSERREDIYMLFRKFTIDFSDKYKTPLINLDAKARMMIENYSWPGNIRELKNVAEQLSVIAEERLITAEILIGLLPNIADRRLPAMHKHGETESFHEREILYKLLFDMKNDLNDLKSLVFELIKTNNLNVPNISRLKQLNSGIQSSEELNSSSILTDFKSKSQALPNESGSYKASAESKAEDKPYIFQHEEENYENPMEVVEESLSLADMEKDMIKKALLKHKGRRKDAAKDLEISERTLYRKIKEYEL